MFDLDDLYQQVILDLNKNPRNYGKLDASSHDAEGHNPLCGDRCRVFVKVEDDRVQKISFDGEGCAISRSAASVMTEAVKGLTLAEIEKLFKEYQDMVMGNEGDGDSSEVLGKLSVFAGVREFPIRVKCAVLAWHTLKAALSSEDEAITTE